MCKYEKFTPASCLGKIGAKKQNSLLEQFDEYSFSAICWDFSTRGWRF